MAETEQQADEQATVTPTAERKIELASKMYERINHFSADTKKGIYAYIGIDSDESEEKIKESLTKIVDEIVDNGKITIHKSDGDTTYDLQHLSAGRANDGIIVQAQNKAIDEFGEWLYSERNNLLMEDKHGKLTEDANVAITKTREAITLKVAEELKKGFEEKFPDEADRKDYFDKLQIKYDENTYKVLAQQLIENNGVKVVDANGQETTLPKEALLGEAAAKIPTKEQVEKIATAVGKAVDENTSDISKSWGLGGADFGNILIGLLTWLLGGMTGGFDGLKQEIANVTAGGIEDATKRHLKESKKDTNLTDEQIQQIADQAGHEVFVNAELEDKRPKPEPAPAKTAPAVVEPAQPVVESAGQETPPPAEQPKPEAQTSVTSPTPTPQPQAEQENQPKANQRAVAGGATLVAAGASGSTNNHPEPAPTKKPEPKEEPSKPVKKPEAATSEPRSANKLKNVVHKIIAGLTGGSGNKTVEDAAIKSLAQNANLQGEKLVSKVASDLINNETTRSIIYTSKSKSLKEELATAPETSSSDKIRTKEQVQESIDTLNSANKFTPLFSVGLSIELNNFLAKDNDTNNKLDKDDLAQAMADFKKSCKGKGKECTPEEFMSFVANSPTQPAKQKQVGG